MYRPEQMRIITELTPQERSKYEAGLRTLWQTVEEKPEGSQEWELARRKIYDFTPVLARKIHERRMAALQSKKISMKQQQSENGSQPMQQTASGQSAAQQFQQAQAVALAAQGQNAAQIQKAQANAQANAQAQAQLRANAAAAAAAAARPGVAGSPPAEPQQQSQAGTAGLQQQPRPQPQQKKFSDAVLQQLSMMSYLPPPAFADKPPAVAAKWQEDVRKKLGLSLSQIEAARANMVKLEATYNARVSKNQLTPEDAKTYKERRDMLQKMLDESARFVAMYRKQQDQTKLYMEQKLMQQQAAAGGAPGGVQQAQRLPQHAGTSNQQSPPPQPLQPQQQKNIKTEPTNMQSSQANINGAIDAAKKDSIAAGARQGAGPNMTINNASNSNNANNNAGAANAPSRSTPGIVQQTPIPPPIIPAAAMQSASKQPPKVPVQTPVHPPPTPANAAMAAANKLAGPGIGGTSSPNTAAAATAPAGRMVPPTQPLANTAPRALSHQKALEEANRQRAASIGGGALPTPPPGHVAAAGGFALGSGAATPGSGGNANATAQSQQIHLAQHQAMQQSQMAMNQQQQQQQQSTAAAAATTAGAQNGNSNGAAHEANRINARVNEPRQISKQLSEKATQMPQPVSLGGGIVPGRPTLTGGGGIVGGVLGQAAIAKVPAIQIEGEGERVLNKKRLDELVRQVCGGTAEGHEGNLLQPEVEEVMSFFLSRNSSWLYFALTYPVCFEPGRLVCR